MDTTAVFAEILVVGLEACVWIALLVGAFFGFDWARSEQLKGWAALVTIIAVASAYTLGIVMDRVFDSLYEWIHPLLEKVCKRLPKTPRGGVEFGERRVRVLLHEGALVPFLEYQRSRQRIARATVFNLPLILACGDLYLGRRGGAGPETLVFFNVSMVVLLALSLFSAWRIGRAYDRRLKNAEDIMAELPAGPKAHP
jgi:hypothetical protein